jgi:ABC-type phosphate transport system substrate-binding protein
MRKNMTWWMMSCGLAALCLALAGCAGGGGGGGGVKASMPQPAPSSTSKSDLLLAAGFQQIFPATPELKARLQAMPQRQIFMASRGSKVFYVYADASGCGCLYAGNQQQYQAYQRLAARARLSAEETAAARIDESMNMSWDEWGEAGPW